MPEIPSLKGKTNICIENLYKHVLNSIFKGLAIAATSIYLMLKCESVHIGSCFTSYAKLQREKQQCNKSLL